MENNRTRYQQMEQYMTIALIADAALFLLFLIFAGTGVQWLKAITAILAAIISALSLAYLFITKELTKRRSLWMTAAAAAILLCIFVSLIFNYPSVSPYKDVPASDVAAAISLITL